MEKLKPRPQHGKGACQVRPAVASLIIQGLDGTIHAVYSYFVSGRKSMKHAAFNEAWFKGGDAWK